MTRVRSTRSLVAAVVAAALAWGTVVAAASPSTSGAPGPSGADLSRFYAQSPTWVDCGQGILWCATVEVPLDHAHPEAGTVGIKVNRVQATGESIGSLVLNPGGPGASGTAFLAQFGSGAGEALLAGYDLVGFDPRGVGASDPVDCLDTAGMDAYLAADRTTETGAADPALLALGEGCAADAMPLAGHMTTVETARDMDILRAVLGRDRLDYFGASYGTFLGTTYASLFPERVGRMVLDGAVDPTLSNPQRTLGQATGFERGLEAYVDTCVAAPDCPLGTTRDAAIATIAGLLAKTDVTPLPTDDADRPLTQTLAFYGITSAMYAKDTWPALDGALAAALAGDGSQLLLLADRHQTRGPDGYTSNQHEANLAVNCLDTQLAADNAVPSLEAFVAQSATFGAIIHGLAQSCEGWPLHPAVAAPDYRAPGASPIVVIGTTRDPATPVEWAQALADRLESGVLITRDGDGHTGYGKGNACVDDAVNAYFLDGAVPRDGLTC